MASMMTIQEEQDTSPQGESGRCSLHRALPDLIRCDECQEVHKDLPPEGKAPRQGLKQSFPVVAIHSDTRLDHLEPEHPSGLDYQKLEDDYDKYVFERSEEKDGLEIEKRRLQLQKQKTNKAKREADRAAQDAEWRIADAQRAADERRGRREQDLQALEVQVRQADILHDEAQREVKKRLAEAEGLKIEEESHLATGIRLLEVAVARRVAAQKRHAELQAASEQRLAQREAEVRAIVEHVEQQEADAKDEAEEHLRLVQEQCERHLRAVREQSAKIKEAVAANLPLAEKRTVAAKEATARRRLDARQRLDVERTTAGIHTTAMEEDCCAMVRRVERREEETKRHLEGFSRGPVENMHRTADLWHHQAERNTLCDKVSLEQTAWVLGHHYKSRWQYTPAVDSKVSNILQGCLHGRDPKSVLPHPSPRGLEPPGDLPQLCPPPWPMLANGLAGSHGA
ncbi:unnamed protein product [Effrenium voratum]|nr:unnamed protein product [Effrenium voratum]